jgi:hypothetical protein
MTAEDHLKVAEVFRRLKPGGEHATVGERLVWRKLVLAVAELAPEAERSLFLHACGFERESLMG